MPSSSYKEKLKTSATEIVKIKDLLVEAKDKNTRYNSLVEQAVLDGQTIAKDIREAIEDTRDALILCKDDPLIPRALKEVMVGTSIKDIDSAGLVRLTYRLTAIARLFAGAYIVMAKDRDSLIEHIELDNQNIDPLISQLDSFLNPSESLSGLTDTPPIASTSK